MPLASIKLYLFGFLWAYIEFNNILSSFFVLCNEQGRYRITTLLNFGWPSACQLYRLQKKCAEKTMPSLCYSEKGSTEYESWLCFFAWTSLTSHIRSAQERKVEIITFFFWFFVLSQVLTNHFVSLEHWITCFLLTENSFAQHFSFHGTALKMENEIAKILSIQSTCMFCWIRFCFV